MSRFLRFFRVLFIAFACVSSVILFRNVFAAGTGITSYTYTLNDDGAKIASVPHSWNMGSVTQLSSLPYKPGYGYGGHYTGTRCTGNRIIDYQGNVLISLNESTTLYACWRPMNPHWNSPIVVLNDAGGSGGAFATPCSDANITYNLNGNYVSYGARGDWATIDTFRSGDYWWIAACARSGGGGELTTMAVTPTRSGYVFRGYYTGQNGTGTQVVYANGNMVDTSNVSTLSSSEPTTIYAYWQQEYGSYLITLNDAGGSGSQVGGNAFLHLYEIYGECYASAISQNSSGTLSGSVCIQAIYATPTRTGYNFGGYYTGQNGTGQQIINASGTIVGSNTYFTSAATIHAKWTPKIYTVTLNHQSATNSPAPSTVYVRHGTGWYSNPGATTTISSMSTIPVRTNYNFAGYYTGTNGTGTRVIDSEGNFLWTNAAINAITSDTTIYAYWVAAAATPVWVTVTLNDQSATTSSSPAVLYRNTNTNVANCSGYKASRSCSAATVTSITPPVKTNYVYGGHYTQTNGGGTQWSNSNGTILYNVTENTEVYAKWTANSTSTVHTITLNANGGTGDLTIYEKAGVGWFRDSAGNYPITNSIYASVDLGGAGLTKPTLVKKGLMGYWTTSATSGGTQIIDENGNIVASPTYSANQIFYARWASLSAVSLNANNGTACATTSVTARYGEAMPNLSCAPTRSGYDFTGYFDATSGGTQYYNADRSSAHTWNKTGAQTLYAQWQQIQSNTYDVYYFCTKEDMDCYYQNGQNCHAYRDVATYNQSYMFKTRAFLGCSEPTGQKFFGWEADDTGSSIQYQPGQIITYTFTSDKILNGIYRPIVPVTLNHGNPNNTPSFDTVYLVPTDGWYSNSSATIGAIFETLPEKYGYEFLGYWTATTGGTKVIDANGDFLVNVFDSTYPSDLYARYSEKIYTINLNDQGATTASAPNPVAYSITRGWFNPSNNATITAITPPTKTGKYFDGFWVDLGEFNTASSGTRITDHNGNFVVNVTQDILHAFALGYMNTIYANWIDQNTVTFSCENQAGDGSGTPNPTTVQIHSGETLTFPSMANCSWGNAGYSPFLWGYVVNGGFTDTHDAGDTITWDSSWGDRTYNMWYAPSYFNYEYSCGAGTGTPPASGNTYYHSNWTTAANTCTKEGYSFAGWLEPVSGVTYAESTMPTNGNVAGWLWPYDVIASAGGAFTAQWTANTYTIAYTLNGGSAGANAPTSGTYDSVVNISNPTHAHATFTGWTIAGMDNGVTHYYGTSNPPTSTTTGTSITTPTKATYYKNLRSVSGTVTFTAVWECNAGYTGTNCNTQVQYPLTWSCGDASGTPSGASFPTTITYGGTLTFPSNPCGSIVGHTFTGWVVDVNATQYNVGSTLTWPFTSGSAITAHYDPVKVNITYSCGGTGTTGSPSKTADNNIDYGSQVTLATLGTCAKAGNTATKWVVSGTNDNYDFGANVTHWNYTENKTLVPNWSAQSYNIIYKDEDGTTVLTGLTPSSYTYGTSTTINAVPTKLHSVFNGWCTGYNTSTKTPTGCTNTNTPLVIGPTETGIKTFYASWSCDAGYIKYADADLYEYIEYGVSDAQSYKARDCAPGYFHLYCNAHGGVACLEQFTINNKTYHFGEVYNTQAIRNSGMYGLLVSGNPVAVSSGTGGALFGHSNSYSVFGLCLASGFPNCNDLLDANATYSDWLDALASATGTTWGRAHHTFNGLWSQETGGTQYLAPNTPLAAMGYEANNNMNLPTLFTSDATLHAQWIPDVYTILLEAEGYDGTLPAVYETYNTGWSQTLAGTPGAWVQLTAAQMASKPGYTLLGYYSTASGTGTKYINGDGTLASGVTPTTFGESTTLHARFQANTYNVTYLCGTDATGTAPASATATYDANFTPASIGGCTNPGRSFAGWLVSNTGNPSDTKQAGVAFQWKYTEDKIFTAQWTDNTYTITFHPGSGVTTTGTTEVQEWYSHAYRVQTSGSMSWTAVTEITLPTKTGYTFAGYYDNASFTGNPVMTNATLPVTTPAATYFTADADLYAKWTKTGYSVTYKNGGGTGNDVVQDVSYDTQFTTKPGSIFTKTNSVVTKWNTTSGGNYPNLNSNYTYSTAGNTVLTANWGACTCTKGTHVASCDVTGVANNTCQYSYTCEAGYNNAGATSGTFNGTANTATNASPNCGGANSYTITVTAGNGISKVTASGWTNSGTATMTKTFDFGDTIDLSTVVTPTQKSGYTGAAYTVTNGAGSISGNVYTVGADNGTITVSATGITTPAGVTITGGTTKVYNLSETTLTGATTTTYDSGITVKYSFGYAPSSNGTYGNWTTASTTKTTSIAKDAFLGTRYYKVRVTASDGTLTSTTTTATTPTTMTLDQKKITFNATTNGGTLSGTSPLYVRYDSANVYTGATSTTTGTVPTASKTGYTFNGWYTAQTGGSQIYNASGTLTSATVSGWTGSSKWRATEDKTLYAQFSANTNTPYKVYHYTKNLTGTGYTLNGAVDNLTGTSNASVTLESLARTLPGFTYDAGFEGTTTHGTTKPASGAVTTTTILPDGTRVIDLYYNRNSYTITYKNGGGTGSDVTQPGISYMGPFTTKPGTTFTKTNSIMTGWNTTSGGNYPLLDHTYSEYDTVGDTVLTAAWATCGCTPGTGVASCTTSATATNTCAATVTCASGYDQSTATWSCSGATCSSSCSADDFEITLNNANATTNGTAKIYTTYGVNVYLDANRSKVMTTSANPITTPERVYTVTYNGNNGTVGTTTAANTTATYTFKGYYSAATNGTQYIVGSTGRITSNGITTGKGYSANATWYAQWTSASVTLPNATRAGYTFAGWYDNATGGNLIGAAGATYTPTEDKTLYAHWNECTAGNYCDGTGTVTSCSTATNGKYPHSAAGSTSINDCYLTTTAGKYVATAGAGEVQCVANDYCAGGVNVYYGGTHSTTHPTKGGNASCSSGTNNKYNYSEAGTGTVNNCYLTLTTGKYVATAGAGMTNCAANNYSDDTTTKIYYGGTASSSHPTTSSCAACSTLGGGLYNKSAGGTGSTGCYVTTTAGKYIIENTDTAQTTCPVKKYCESATIYWPNVGQIADCPVADATTAMTSYPSNYYNPTLSSISNQAWSTGITSINGCMANYSLRNARGDFTVESVKYNSTSGKYDNGGSKYYRKINAGYYGNERYSATYCDTATHSMIYKDALPCPAGSYCPGLTSMPLCSSGTYAETIGLYSCPTNYPDSAAMSTNINACYLTTTAGKYVATAGAGEVQCSANNYCTGDVVVHYDGIGGITACSTGAGSNYATSAAGSDSNTDCYKTVTLDKNGGSGTIQGTSGTNPASVVCHYNTECNFGSASGLTQTGYTFSGGWGTTNTCSGTTVKFTVPNDTGTYYACKSGQSKTCNPGYYLKADNATCTACPAGKYCVGGTFTFNGSDQGISGDIAAGYYADGCAKTSTGAVCSTSYHGGMVSGGYYSTGGGTSSTPTAAGNGCLSGKSCGKLDAAYYGNGGSTSNGATCISGQVCGTCDTNYRANTTTGKTVVTQCETQCAAGKQVAAANAACSTPNGSWYTSQHNVAYGSKSSDTSNVVKACATNYATANTTTQTDHDAQSDCKRTITLDKNGGTGTVDASVVCSEGVACNLPDASGLNQTGYTFAGSWSTTSGAGATGCVSTVTTPTSGTYYACKSGQSKTCNPGYYLKANNATCTACPAGKYCEGGTFTFNGTDQGITGNIAAGYYANGCAKTSVGAVCSTSYSGGIVSGGYYSTGGGTSATPTAAGNGCLSGNTCGKLSAPYYSNGGSKANDGTCVSGQTCGTCDSNYRANTTTGKTAVTQCQTQCAAGSQVATANAACSTPSGSWYTAQHLVNYGSKSSDTSGVVKSCATNYATANTTTQTDHDAQSDCKRTITLNKNGGTGTVDASVVCSEGVACNLPDASGLNQTGYTFAGSWSTTSGAGATGCVSTVTTPTSGTYYACKSANTITIKLNKNGGTGTCGGATGVSDGTLTCTYDGSCTAPAWDSTTCNINNGSKIFTGWNTASDGSGTSYAPGASIQNIIGSGTTTIYAVWSDVTCNVTNGSGTASNTTTNTPVCAVTCTNGYSKTGYMNATTTFNVTGNVGATTVTSSCAARTYKVTLDPKRYASASAQTGVEPDSTGTTAYWYRYKTKSPCYYYKVELNSASDEVASNCIAGTGGVTITPPTMAGYTFGGYYKSKPGTGTQYVTNVGGTTNNIYSNVAADSTLYAKWTAKTYTVTLNKNATDAVAGTSSVTATYNAAMPTSGVTMPTRTGYGFVGYYDTSAATGGKQYYTSTGTSANNWDKTANTTLYARWTADCNEITVDNTTRGGTTANTKLYKNSGDTKWYSDSSCQTVVTTTPRPSKTNATFSGYYTSATNTTTQVGTNANPSVLSTTWTVTEPTTIYAHYNCNTGWQEDGTDIAGTCIGTITATASDKVLTYNGTNGNNGTAQSCANVTVTTPASGASVTYATKTGTTCGQYGNAPTLTNVNDGPKTICYKVTATNYETVTGEYTCSMNKANGNVVLSATTGSTVYPNTKTFTVTTNKSGGALSATPTSGNVVATASVSGTTVTATPQKTGTQTITVTSAETVNYNAATATYTLTVTDGGITHDVGDVSKTYDGTPLVCNGVTNVVPTSAEVKYRTATSGAYNLTSAPSITNVADSKTIYYQITADNYATVTGQFNCTVTKADCPITVKEGNTTLTSSSVVTLTYPTSKTLTATSSCGNAVTLSSGNTSYITVSDKTLNPVKVTSSNITMTASVEESANYNGATASFKAKVVAGTITATASNKSLTYNGTTTSNGTAQSCANVTVTSPSGTTTSYAFANNGSCSGVTYGSDVTMTNVSEGTKTVCYKVTKTNYADKTGEYTCTMNAATPSYTKTNKTKTYDGTALNCNGVSFTGTGNKPTDGIIKYSSSQTGAYTTTVPTQTNVGSQTVWFKVSGTNFVESAPDSFTCSVTKASMNPSASNNSKEYDGSALTCNGNTWSGVPAGSTKYYSTDGGNTYNTTVPTRINAGSQTINWKVTNPNYDDATGSFTCTVTKADCGVTLSKTSDTTTYNTAKTFTASTASGCSLSVSPTSGSTNVAIASITNGTVTVTPQKTGSQTVTVTASADGNHNDSTATYKLTVNPADFTVTKPTNHLTYNGTATNNGTAQTCSGVTVSDLVGGQTATIKYGTASGTYNNSTPSSITNAGDVTVYYQVTAPNHNTQTGEYTCTMDPRTSVASASNKALTYDGTAQSCANVTLTYPTNGTIKWKTSASGNYGTTVPTMTNVSESPKTIYYQVSGTNFTTITGQYQCTMAKANCTVSLNPTSGTTTYPNTKTFTASTSSGGTLSVSPTSGSTNVAIASISNGTVTATPQKTGTQTITVTSAATSNYNSCSANYTLTVTDGGITHDVSDVSKTYDGTPLVCNGVTNVVPTSAEVKYRTATSGAYNLTSAPSITNVADSKTIYYQITADNYATVTGQFNCTVTKADCPITVKEGNTTLTSSSVVTLTYPTSKTLTATSSCGNAVTLSSGNTSYITVSDKTLNPVKVTSSNITMTASVAESANYNGATASFKAKVNRGDCSITLNPTSGSGTCASNTATFTIDKGSCNGTITASSSDEDIATVALNSAKTQGTVTRVSAGSATITVNVAQTDQYNATSAEYTFSGNKVAGSTTIKDGGTTVSSGSVAYPNTKTLTATCAGGATPTISNAGTTSVATATISNGTITMTPLKQGTSTITVSCPATDCYNASTATYKLTVNRGTCSITLNPTSGTITYPTENTATFAINKGSCNGTITASSSDTNIATVALNSGATQGTVSYVAPGTATITVSSAQTDQYNAVSATYEVTNQLETYTITFKTGNKTMGTQSCTYGQNVTLNDVAGMPNIPVATNKGWGFDGWANNVDTTNTDYANQGSMTCGGNVTLYGVWKRDIKFTYFETATSTANKTSTKQQYYRNTTTSAAGVSGVTTYPLYTQSDYAWAPLGWATTTGATSASISQTGATTTTVTPGATTGTSAGVAYYAVYNRTPQIAYNGNGNTGGSTANTNCEPQTFNAGATNGTTPACTLANNGFTRTGYTFNKWAAGSATGDQYAASESYTFTNKTWTSAKTYTMYANWSANTITLNFASEHGTAPASTTCSYGSTFNMPAAITGVVGYTFHRWNVNSNNFDANETGVACDNATLGVTSGSVTINATWKNNHYRILLDDNGGNGGQVAENSTWGMYEWYGQCYIAAQVLNNVDLEASTCLDYIYTAPTKQGYTFTGYYTENDEQVIAADKRVVGSPTLFEQNDTIYAHWTANSDIQYKVYHYTKNLGTNTYSLNGAVDTLYGVADSTVTLSVLARTITGFTYDAGFDGTATHGTTKPASGAVLTTTILPNGTRVIDLYYNRDTHTVTLSKGTGIASVTGAGTYEYGASVSINATMNNGYDWYRWTNTNTGAAVTTTKAYTFTMETADIAYTANANVHSYTITYDLNQGTSSTTPVHGTNHPETYKVTDATFTISNPTMTGYTFAGWTVTTAPEGWGSGSSTSGSTNFKVGRGTYGNIAFRATWTANTYSIAYTLNGGAYGASHPASATFDAAFTVNNPTHEHATFSGWNISGMDTTTHTYGTQTTNTTTLSDVTATTFKNLRSTSGTVTFTATWNCNTGYAGTNCDAIDYNMQYVCSDGTESANWTFGGSAPVATNPVHYGQSVQLAGDVYAQTNGCRKVWGTSGDADYCNDCFTFGGWTIDAESTAIPTAPAHAANSTVNPWGRTNTTDWCIISDTGNCADFADDIFYVRAQYTPKQYNIEYMYATSPVSGASANMPASYTYTTETTISNADQTAPAHATFNGWCTGANGTGTCFAAGQPITIGNRDHGDMRYYANWSCDTGYTLTYDANNQPVCSANTYNIDYVFNGGAIVPAEYTPVEYIQGNGSSYIDTGVVPTMNTGAYMKAALTTRKTSDNIILGATNANAFANGAPMSIDVFAGYTLLPHGGTASSYASNKVTLANTLNTVYEYKVNYMNSGKASVNSTQVNVGASTSMTNKSLHVFNLNTSTGGTSQYATNGARVYSLILTEGSEISHHYVPVRRSIDNKCGLYDGITGEFLTSATSTALSCPNTEYTGGYPDSYTYGIGADITGVPTRAHSTFVGWCENSGLTNNCVTPQNVSTTAMGNKTFWAKWACNAGYTANAAGTACNPNTIALSYRNGGHGTAPTAPASCVYGENVNLPAAITATGYTFNKWAVADNNFAANATIVCNSANLGVTSGTAIITATWTTDSITCAAKKYLPAGATVCVDCIAGGYCPGGTYTYNPNLVQGITVCATNTYSNAAAAQCTACLTANGYQNSGDEFADHAYESSCKTTCAVGQCVATARAACANVGTTGWATGGVVAQGDTLACNVCQSGTSTCGYGACADEAGDCGRVLHVGANKLYLRSDRKTDRTLNIKIGNNIYYANMSPSNLNMSNGVNKSFKIKVGNAVYSVYDDSVGE